MNWRSQCGRKPPWYLSLTYYIHEELRVTNLISQRNNTGKASAEISQNLILFFHILVFQVATSVPVLRPKFCRNFSPVPCIPYTQPSLPFAIWWPLLGHIADLAVKGLLLTIDSWVRLQASPYGICGGQGSSGTDFCHILSCFTSQYHSSGVPLSVTRHLYCTALVNVSGG